MDGAAERRVALEASERRVALGARRVEVIGQRLLAQLEGEVGNLREAEGGDAGKGTRGAGERRPKGTQVEACARDAGIQQQLRG